MVYARYINELPEFSEIDVLSGVGVLGNDREIKESDNNILFEVVVFLITLLIFMSIKIRINPVKLYFFFFCKVASDCFEAIFLIFSFLFLDKIR